MRRLLRLCTVALLAAGSLVGAAVPDLNQTGAVRPVAETVDLPEIATLGCKDMQDTLAWIDRSGYRGFDPLPKDHPDYALFLYEDRLASAFFHACTHNTVR
ncbi:MAG: hypothetical protein AAGI34_06400 [Pseudomonadota bacterium]